MKVRKRRGTEVEGNPDPRPATGVGGGERRWTGRAPTLSLPPSPWVGEGGAPASPAATASLEPGSFCRARAALLMQLRCSDFAWTPQLPSPSRRDTERAPLSPFPCARRQHPGATSAPGTERIQIHGFSPPTPSAQGWWTLLQNSEGWGWGGGVGEIRRPISQMRKLRTQETERSSLPKVRQSRGWADFKFNALPQERRVARGVPERNP